MSTPISEPAPILRPRLVPPGADSNKYTRGKVAVVAGAMAGAALLAATAAQRAGAGYVELIGASDAGPPHALVRRAWQADALRDPRVGAVAVGPGLGLNEAARARLDAALDCGRPLVIDADAVSLLAHAGRERIAGLAGPVVLTPHAGEFARLFGEIGDDRIAAARRAAAAIGAIVLLKGSRSIVAAPDGAAVIAAPAPAWLSSAGTGDVLSGIVAAMLAQREEHGFSPLAAVSAALWLHGEAARLAGPCLIADDLVTHLPAAVAACL